MYYAQQVCQECGKCAGSFNGDETEESMDEFDCNDECSDDQKMTVLNLISASTSSECATLMAITMNEDSDGPTDDQICGCLSSGHDFSSISSYNCKMSCEDVQDVSVYVAGNGTCSGSDSKCNDPCPVGYFKDATYDTMCIGDNWNGNYCSLCGGDNGGWVMDPCSIISGETTDSTGGAETTESAECKEVLLDESKYLYFVCANMDYNGLTRAEVCPNLGTDYWSHLTPEQVISVQDCCCQEYEESLMSEEETATNFLQQVVDSSSSAGDLVILGFAAIGVFAMFATAYRMLKKDDDYNLISEEDL
jgi:hypothetical protein